jgi:hypothetical protein
LLHKLHVAAHAGHLFDKKVLSEFSSWEEEKKQQLFQIWDQHSYPKVTLGATAEEFKALKAASLSTTEVPLFIEDLVFETRCGNINHVSYF